MTPLMPDQAEIPLLAPALSLAGTSVGMWALDVNDDYITGCEEWFQLYGIANPTDNKIHKDNWWNLVHDVDKALLASLDNDIRSGKITSFSERFRIRQCDGTWRWILSRANRSIICPHSGTARINGVDVSLYEPARRSNTEANISLENSNSSVNLRKTMHGDDQTMPYAFESSGQGFWYVDRRNGVVTEHDIWRAMRGHSVDSIGDSARYDDVHPDDLELVINSNDLRGENDSDIISYTYRHRHTDGSWLWIWVRGRILERNDDGSPVICVGANTDITAIKDTEQRFERLSSTLDLAMQAAGMGVWEWQVGAQGSYWDTRTCRLFGISGDGRFVPKIEFTNSVHPDDLEKLAQQLSEATDALKSIAVAYRINHPELGTRYLQTRADCHTNIDGSKRYVGIVWDVTDAREREIELADANHLLDDVVEHMDQGLVLFRGDDLASAKIGLANGRLSSILDLPVELRMKNATFNEYANYLHGKGYLTGQSGLSAEHFIKRIKENIVSADLLTTPAGRKVRATAQRMNPESVIMTFSDITDIIHAEQERKELTERLHHSQRLQSIGELTGGIAHDFNNLLAVISGNAELLGISSKENSPHLEAITEAADRGAELTQSLLAFSRKQALHPTPINMNVLVIQLCSMLNRTLGDSIVVETSMPAKPWLCMADRGQLENALINLAVNARDAMPRGGTLSIDIQNTELDGQYEGKGLHNAMSEQEATSGDYVQVTVSDTGTGMSQEVLRKAIDPFFTTKSIGKGSGLGLSMVFGFIKQSSGHIDISSEPGIGTTIKLLLPRSDSEFQCSDNKPAVGQHWPKGSGERILLVEDDQNVEQMLKSSLLHLGYDVESVTTSSEAIEKVQNLVGQLNLVLSDVMLRDGVNGFELGRLIKEADPDLPIVYVSGYAQTALASINKSSDDIELIHKPFTMKELATKISRHIRVSQRSLDWT